jgi:hypothetical protein
MFLDIIYRLVHFLKNHNVSETGFCLRPQVKPTQLDPIDRASPCTYNKEDTYTLLYYLESSSSNKMLRVMLWRICSMQERLSHRNRRC